MAGGLDLIRAKQRELADAKAAADKLIADRERAATVAFAETGIPAMWEQIKNVKVPHYRGNGSREHNDEELVPLHIHAKEVTATEIKLLDWDGERKASWSIEVTDKGAVWFVRRYRPNIEARVYYDAQKLLDDFVEYMANLLPPLEDTK
jgi:hypothetical protein